jgi:hypothetical protein
MRKSPFDMKELHEYDTPENAELVDAMNGDDDAAHLIALDGLSRNLEQRLAACRDALNLILESDYDSMTRQLAHNAQIARETLTITAPK